MMTSEAPEEMRGATGKNRWFQMGLITAGAMAPLIARWRNLRAAEQAEAVREQANVRWNAAVDWMAQSLPNGSVEGIQERLRQAIPQQAQDALRQAPQVARDALNKLPIALPGVTAPEPPARASASSRQRVNVALWTLGVGVGLAAAGTAAYIILRQRMNARDDEALMDLPLTQTRTASAQASAAMAPAVADPAITTDSSTEEPEVAEEPVFSEADAVGARFVGNINSGVYQPITAKRLPAPEHRTYFASEEQAVRAGYRRNGD